MPRLPHSVAILTDFGQKDWYVAAMKGVIAKIAPSCPIVDITHEIPPGDTTAAAFVLSQCFHNFPSGTVFLCVVDPGVGTTRLPIILFNGDYHFVAPDNGLLTFVKQDIYRAFEIDPTRIPIRSGLSATFHGRDLFAPVAACLAKGDQPLALARPIPEIKEIDVAFFLANKLPAHGQLVHFDHFGNGISNLVLDSLDPEELVLENGIRFPFASTFGSVKTGRPVAYIGSGGLVEIAINNGSAREDFRLERGMTFTLI